MVKVIALVPSPIYNTPPHALNGEVPHVKELVLVEDVMEHCAFPSTENNNKKNNTIYELSVGKSIFIKQLKI
jgi:hypothetical protein